jgi:hypothetical protein
MTNSNISEAAFSFQKLPEDECKFNLMQSDCIISNLKATIDDLTKTVQSLNQTVQLQCGQRNDVSTGKVETVTTSKWTEIPPAINIATFLPNNVVS